MKWEYKTYTFTGRNFWGGIKTDDLNTTLNRFGSEGWEMVNVTAGIGWGGGWTFFFKRTK